MGRQFGFGFGRKEQPLVYTKEVVSKLSNEELLDRFKTQNWDNHSKDEHLNIVQELENRQAASEQREAANIRFEKMGINTNGSFYHNSNNIYLNYDKLKNDQYKLMNTYYHEKQTRTADQLTRECCWKKNQDDVRV